MGRGKLDRNPSNYRRRQRKSKRRAQLKHEEKHGMVKFRRRLPKDIDGAPVQYPKVESNKKSIPNYCWWVCSGVLVVTYLAWMYVEHR